MASPSHSWYVTVIFFGLPGQWTDSTSVCFCTDWSARIALICRHDSGNCATSPRNLTTIQAVNQSASEITTDPHQSQTTHPLPAHHLSFSKKPFDFSGVFFPPNKVDPFAGGAGLPSEVETWQNEDDRPASEGVEEMEEGSAGGGIWERRGGDGEEEWGMTLADLMMKVMKGVSLRWRNVKFSSWQPSDGCQRFNNRSALLSSGQPAIPEVLGVANSKATLIFILFF